MSDLLRMVLQEIRTLVSVLCEIRELVRLWLMVQEKEKQKDEEEKKESTKERKEEEERIREKEPTNDIREGVLGETNLVHSLAGPSGKRAKRKRTCKPMTTISSDEGLSEKGEAYARSVGMSEEQVWEEFENFKDYHLRKGNMWADWSAAWRTWCRNWKKYRKDRGSQSFLKEIKS